MKHLLVQIRRVILVYAFVTVVQSIEDEAPTVETNTGKLVGSTVQFTHKDIQHTVHVYRGIPYAEPPIGNLRFRPPVPKSPWSGEYNATYFRNVCMQPDMPIFPPDLEPRDEDCLYLNVYVPQPKPTKAAVMFWIHGGALHYGSGSNILYEASPLAALNDVIFVSINYRLGLFGLLSTGDSVASGNYGLSDQIQALKWVNENIAAFGGDKDRITIFGQSAGSFSVHFHVVSPLSTGLFQRAIMESGSAFMDNSVLDDAEMENIKAHGIGKLVGCDKDSSEELLECLRQVPVEDFSVVQDPALGALANITGRHDAYFLPFVDGHIVKEHPKTTISEKTFNKVDTMIGTTADEGMMFVVMALAHQANDSEVMMDEATFDAMLSPSVLKPPGNYPMVVDSAKMLYTNWEEADSTEANYAESFSQIVGDQMFVCPADATARAHYEAGLNVYLYQFDHHPSTSLYPAKWCKAAHGEEMQYQFSNDLIAQIRPGDDAIDKWTVTDEEAAMTSQIMTYFTNFAKTGNPNLNEDGTATDIEWPKFTVPELQYKELSPSMPTKRALKAKECAFWNQLVPTLMKQSDSACDDKSEAVDEATSDKEASHEEATTGKEAGHEEL
ncbi:acetylcholinesterase-like [Glandiceps talaboti]